MLTLSEELYSDLGGIREEFRLDFDDAYQFKIAEEYGLSIVTQDKDFEKVSARIEITFL
jgi:predicted nucleic acid-binding protein